MKMCRSIGKELKKKLHHVYIDGVVYLTDGAGYFISAQEAYNQQKVRRKTKPDPPQELSKFAINYPNPKT